MEEKKNSSRVYCSLRRFGKGFKTNISGLRTCVRAPCPPRSLLLVMPSSNRRRKSAGYSRSCLTHPLPGKRSLLFLHHLSICEMWLHGKAVTFRHPWIWGCLLGSVLQQLPGSSWGKCGRGGPRHRRTWICWVGMLAAEPGVIAETRNVCHIMPKRFFAGQEGLKYLPSLGSGSYAKGLAVWFS